MRDNNMEKQCRICGGKLISARLTTGAHLLGVTPVEDAKKMKPRYSNILCDTCVQCGSVENIRVEEPDKLK